MPGTACVRCGAETGVIRIELAGISTGLCLECSEVVTTAARKVAAEITQRAVDVVTTIADRARAKKVAIDRPAAAWVASEVAFFYLHVADRMAFDALTGVRALYTRSLMDELVAGSLSHLGFSRGAPRYDEVRQEMISSLNARQVAYGSSDGSAMFAQFTALLNRFFTDAAPSIHQELTAFTAGEVTNTWRAIEPMVRQSLASIDTCTSAAVEGTEPRPAKPLASAPDSNTTPPEPPAATRAKPGVTARLWRGEIPLVKAYWLYGVLLNVLFTIVAFVVGEAAPELVLLWWPLYLAYFVLIVVAIWRSSERYRGPKIWSILARISVMLGIGRTLLDIYLQLKYPL